MLQFHCADVSNLFADLGNTATITTPPFVVVMYTERRWKGEILYVGRWTAEWVNVTRVRSGALDKQAGVIKLSHIMGNSLAL